MKIRPFILTVLIASTTLAYSQSAVPTLINYQGRVSDASGNLLGSPVAVNRTVTIRVYDHACLSAPANLLYSEQQTATINGGEFSVLIGAGAAVGAEPKPALDSVFNGNLRYLGVTVDDGTAAVDIEILPRQQMTSNPFSLRAKVAETALVASNLIQGSGTQSALTVSSLGYTTQNFTTDGTVDGTSPNILASAQTAAVTATLPASAALKELVFTKTDNTANPVTVAPPAGGTINGSIAPIVLNKLGDSVTIRNVGGTEWWVVAQQQIGAVVTDNAGDVTLSGQLTITGTTHHNGDTNLNGATFARGILARGGAPGALGVDNNGYSFSGNGGDNDSGMFSLGDGQVNFFTQSVERMRISDLGGIGIGTSNPGATVHVIRNSAVGENESLRLEVPGNPILTQFYRGANGDHYLRSGTSDGRVYLQDIGGGNVIIGGNVAQRGKLHVAGSVNSDNGTYAFYAKNGSGQPNTAGSAGVSTYSIYAENRVAAIEFNAFSDARIKNIVGVSDGASDLTALMGIQVTDYTFRDTLKSGKAAQKKVVAQQVEKVFPLAVSKSTEVLPDIMKKAEIRDGWVALSTDLKKSEKVRLLAGKGTDKLCEVLEVKDGKFRVSFDAAEKEVFVYGREVSDFRTVDYDAIAMLNVSATQEIKKASDTAEEALRKENAELRAKVAELEKTIASTAQTTEARLAAIEASLRKVPSATAASKPEQDVTPASISTRQ